MKTRDRNVDILRIMACAAVVGLHTVNKDASVANGFLYYLCGFAVPMFFMMSGYLLLNRSGGYSYKYVGHKILSICRLVVLWNVIYWLYDLMIMLLKNSLNMTDFWSLPKNIVNNLIQVGPCGIFWYFGALMLVYLILPLIANKRVEIKFAVFVIAFCICEGIQVASIMAGWPIQTKVVQTFRIWTWVAYFMLGGFIPQICRWTKSHVTLLVHTVGTVLVAVLIGIYQTYMGCEVIAFQDSTRGITQAEYFYDSIFTFLWVVLIFTLVKRIDIRDKDCIRIESLSSITLGIYCGHMLVKKVVAHLILASSLLNGIILWGLVLTLTAVAIYIINRFTYGKYFTKM